MKQVKRYLLSFVGGLLLAIATVNAQEAKPNSIESMTVAQQGGVLNVKLVFKEPLNALPPGFSVAKPARRRLVLLQSVLPDVYPCITITILFPITIFMISSMQQ